MTDVELNFRLRHEGTTAPSSSAVKLTATEKLARAIAEESNHLTSIQLLSSQVIVAPLEPDLFSVKLSAKARKHAAGCLVPVYDIAASCCVSAARQRSGIQMKFEFESGLAATHSDLVLMHNLENFASFALGALLHGNTFASAFEFTRLPQSDGVEAQFACRAVGPEPQHPFCCDRSSNIGSGRPLSLNLQCGAERVGANDNSQSVDHLSVRMASNFPRLGKRQWPSDPTAKINFEHDRKICFVEFLAKDALSFGRTSVTWHEMIIPYENIREILVDCRDSAAGDIVVYLELKYPVTVKKKVKREKNRVTSFGPCTKEHLGNCSCLQFKLRPRSEASRYELCRLIRRLHVRSGADLWFGAVPEVHLDCCSAFPSPHLGDLTSSQKFAVHYALHAIWSAGYVARCQLTASFVRVINAIAGTADFSLDALLQTLFRFANAYFDGRKASLACFRSQYVLALKRLTGRLQREDPRCVFVRKVIRTPTRILYLEPERMLMNRFIEDYCRDPAVGSPGEPAIRIVYRDENLRKLYFSDNAYDRMDSVFAEMIDTLTWGLPIAERQYHFVAASNSQLRDHSCYMFARLKDKDLTTTHIREKMGQFRYMKGNHCVSKVLARMGQCFTQAFPTLAIPIHPVRRMREDDDTMSTISHPDHAGDFYCFTDGIGRVSPGFLRRVVKLLQEKFRMKIDHFPSAIQIRYQGFKGMLAVDPNLDDESDDTGLFAVFRKSMNKFETPDGHRKFILEVVKWSQPVEVYLNRPLIEVFDKSTLADVAASARIKACVHDLLERQLFGMFEMLVCERAAKAVLNRKTTIDLRFLGSNEAFVVTSEPFFRSLLHAIYLSGIRHINKLNVAIPHDSGRTMFGVIDERGVLGLDQVYVRYSSDMRSPGENLKTHVGPIIVTKNPTTVPGDLRVLNAIDCPQLSHLVDVIVFPAGPPDTRPLPDQMAGSDLDGDEFSIFFCDGLLFTRNHLAMTFPKTAAVTIDHIPGEQDFIKFFSTYVQNDIVGQVANCLLAQSDRLGFQHQLVIDLAKKYSIALDFAKTGVPVRLSKDEKEGNVPDFMEQNRLSYRSQSLVGELHRKIKLVTDSIALAEKCADSSAVEVRPDPVFSRNADWMAYKDEAIRLRDEYVVQITSLLDAYGIPSEAQLLSGHIVSLKNRIDSNEKENFTRFTTDAMIEQCVKDIWQKFRALFYEGMHDGVCVDAVQVANAKATAWYMVTYDKQYGNSSGLLGFPWIVGDYLVPGYKPPASLANSDRCVQQHMRGPIVRRLFDELSKNAYAISADAPASALRSVKISRLSRALHSVSADVQLALLAWLRWLDSIDCLDPIECRPVGIHSIVACELFLTFALYHTPGADGAAAANVLISFFKYLATNDFRLQRFGYTVRLAQSVVLKLHKGALSALHHVAFTGLFDSLQLAGKSYKPTWDYGETRMLQIDGSAFGEKTGDECLRLLKAWSGCAEVVMRPLPYPRGVCAITGAGTLESRRKLESILMCPGLGTAFEMGVTVFEDLNVTCSY